jgi:hypothetical protein
MNECCKSYKERGIVVPDGEEPLYVHSKRNAVKETNEKMLNALEGENVTFVSYDTVEVLTSIHDKNAARTSLWKNEFLADDSPMSGVCSYG